MKNKMCPVCKATWANHVHTYLEKRPHTSVALQTMTDASDIKAIEVTGPVKTKGTFKPVQFCHKSS